MWRVLEKKELRDYVSGKSVLIVSTERTFCEYTYEVMREVGRYARKYEMLEVAWKSTLFRLIYAELCYYLKNIKKYDVIVLCSENEKSQKTAKKQSGGKKVLLVNQRNIVNEL